MNKLKDLPWCKISATLTSALAAVAALPYQLGDISTLIPPEWKAKVTAASIIATVILRLIGHSTPEKK